MSKPDLPVFDSRKSSKGKPPVKLFIMMRNLSRQTQQNTQEFILINNYHGLSTLKSQITNMIKELVLERNYEKFIQLISETLH